MLTCILYDSIKGSKSFPSLRGVLVYFRYAYTMTGIMSQFQPRSDTNALNWFLKTFHIAQTL